jgi:hypothetical protein
METNLGEAQNVSFEKGNGQLPDVLAQQHGSAFESDLRLFQFIGSRYQLTKCMNKNYQDPSDPEHILDKPIITEQPCQ